MPRDGKFRSARESPASAEISATADYSDRASPFIRRLNSTEVSILGREMSLVSSILQRQSGKSSRICTSARTHKDADVGTEIRLLATEFPTRVSPYCLAAIKISPLRRKSEAEEDDVYGVDGESSKQ